MVNRFPLGPALGEVIRELRRARGLTQAALARDADIHENYARGIENGRFNPSVLILGRIAQVLDVRLSELFAAAERRHEG